jgi:WD40 repeat protein
VQIFDAITCHLAPPGRFEAHSSIVYDLAWSADSRLLVSCSGDCTAKVWYLDAACISTHCNQGPLSSPRLASVPYCTVLHHSSYVYCCRLHPHASLGQMAAAQASGTCTNIAEATLLLLTGCADGMLYFWSLTADMDPLLAPDGGEPLLQKRAGSVKDSSPVHVNALLWDLDAPSQLHDNTHQQTRASTSGRGALQCCAAQHASLVGASAGHDRETASGDGDAVSAACPPSRGACTQSACQHRGVLFAGMLPSDTLHVCM